MTSIYEHAFAAFSELYGSLPTDALRDAFDASFKWEFRGDFFNLYQDWRRVTGRA